MRIPRAPRARRRFAAALPAAALVALFWPGLPAAHAQAPKKVSVYFGDSPDPTKLPDPPDKLLFLRPNVERQVYVFAHNEDPVAGDVTIELRAGAKAETLIAKGTHALKPNEKDATLIPLASLTPAAPAVPAPPPPPGAKPAPLPLVSWQQLPLRVRAVNANGDVLYNEEVHVIEPTDPDYFLVDKETSTYDPATHTHRLTFRVTAGPRFFGPEARVELALRPDRIPGLLPKQKREGTYAGVLKKPGDEVVLDARGLLLRDAEDVRNGLVYITIDGYPRAFTYYTTFARTGGVRTPTRVEDPVLRLSPPPAGLPGPSTRVHLEADNVKDWILEVGFDRDGDGVFNAKQNEVFPADATEPARRGARRHEFTYAFAEGAAKLRGITEDWSIDLDTTDVFGTRLVRLRLLERADPEGKDPGLPFTDSKVKLSDPSWTGATRKEREDAMKRRILAEVVLDGDPPAGKFLEFPQKLVRGSPLPVYATATAASGIKSVAFFPGKPGPDGKLPAGVVPVEGLPDPDEDDVWGAKLAVPTTAKATFDVSMQVTSNVELTEIKTVTIQLVDPPPPTPPPVDATIEGTVTQGGTVKDGGRAQPGVAVVLRDVNGVAKDSTVTNDKGKYVFTKVPPGPYRVGATKTADFTRAEVPVEVTAGQTKKDVDLVLSR